MSDAPFFAGRIEGIRAWSLSDDLELRGRGIGSSEGWAADGEPTQAVCLDSNHPAPRSGCECGLYALHPQARISDWVESFMTDGVAGVVEAWGRIELHQVGFRAEFARPKLLFEPASHLISSERLTGIYAVARRYGVPVVPLSRPEHAGEWCRVRGIGLAPEVLQQTLLQGVRLRLRRTSRVSLDRRWLRVGVWPQVVGSPSSSPEEVYTRVQDLPGIRICTVRVRGAEAIGAFESEEFDPGRRLRLVRKATWDYEGVEVRSECGRIRLGSLAWPTARDIGPRLEAGRIAEVRSLTRSIGLRDRAKRTGFLTILIVPDLPIEVEPEPEPTLRLEGGDWTECEPRVEP